MVVLIKWLRKKELLPNNIQYRKEIHSEKTFVKNTRITMFMTVISMIKRFFKRRKQLASGTMVS